MTAMSTGQFVIAGLDPAIHLFKMIQVLSACADDGQAGLRLAEGASAPQAGQVRV